MYPAEKFIRRNPLIKKIFTHNGELYLVGGYIRDAVLGIRSRDIDIAVRGISARKLAFELQKITGGTVFDLRGEHIVRIALKGGVTIDISSFKGSLHDELKRRDFTVNSIAWSPESGFFDPFGGIGDLRDIILRANMKKNIRNDPLRCLRIYRMMGCYGLIPVDRTRGWARDLSYSMEKVATERITLEFFKLLDGKHWYPALKMALEDGVLKRIIPLKNSQLEANLKLVSKVTGKPDKALLRKNLRNTIQGMSGIGLIRLEGLALGVDIGSLRLSLSSLLRRRIERVNSCYKAASRLRRNSGLSELFDLFEESKDTAPDVLMLAQRDWALEEYRRYVKITRRPIISAEEIMEEVGIKEGPLVGRLMREIGKKRFIGEVRGIQDAMKFISKIKDQAVASG